MRGLNLGLGWPGGPVAWSIKKIAVILMVLAVSISKSAVLVMVLAGLILKIALLRMVEAGQLVDSAKNVWF